MSYPILYLIIGIIIGALIAYFIVKSNHVSRNRFSTLSNDFTRIETEYANLRSKSVELSEELQNTNEDYRKMTNEFQSYRDQLVKINSEREGFENESKSLKEKIKALETDLHEERKTIIDLNATVSSFSANNQSLKEKINDQKGEFEELQRVAKLQFEQIANKILEEKTEKFTQANHESLKNILHPFKENIEDLKKRVNETYDRESKERFSLGERVKELHQLNQQISADAKNLTQALKGESKTQGNWGEMILESILEKSGLRKDQEYFLEYQLHDADNNALRSDAQGKKMRPDAVVKYPGNREVIIDSKVSLTAFTRLVDSADDETYRREMHNHLASVKGHIHTLSTKGYDDYNKSLDFVMMFIPSEPAYIAAMQGDPNLWQYAYDKRILLLSPTNLITSLKLISDLWKREYQNQNATEIAERGAKLYDKFVGFVENIEKVGKSIQQSKTSFNEAYKQLYTGNDNLVRQAQKLVDLGVKNKKNLNPNMVDASTREAIESPESKTTPEK